MPVKSDLIVQANRPVVFDEIDGFPGWRVADLFFRDREAQAAVAPPGSQVRPAAGGMAGATNPST